MVAALTGSGAAWAEPEMRLRHIGLYGGVAGGFSASQRDCQGASKDACERASYGHKLFAGYKMTPGLAAEVNYFYFNGVNTDYTTQQNASTARVRESARAMTLGINWSVELINGFTNHIKVGMARSKKMLTSTPYTGADVKQTVYSTAPYLGAGISYSMSDSVKFDTGFDYIIDGHDSRYLFSVGVSGEF